MKNNLTPQVGDLVEINTSYQTYHNCIGIVINSSSILPGGEIYYSIMLKNNKILKFKREQLIIKNKQIKKT